METPHAADPGNNGYHRRGLSLRPLPWFFLGVCALVVYAIWQTRQLTEDVLRVAALQGASAYANTLGILRRRNKPGAVDFVPPEVRVFRTLPFRDEFEQAAWQFLFRNPDEAFFRFEDRPDGKTLRYAVAEKGRKGEVHGVLSVTRPLDQLAMAVSPAVEARSWMIVLVAFAALASSAFLFLRLRRVATALATSNRRLQSHLEAQDAWAHEVYVSRERLRIVMDQIPAVIWTTDKNLLFTSSEGGGLKGLGLKPNELMGKSLYEYFGTDDKEFLPISSSRRALKGEPTAFDTVWMDRHFAAHVEPLRDRLGKIQGTIGAAIDITEHKQREARLMMLAEDLTRSNRDLEVFAFSASHDLKEPLRTITAHLQLLAHRLGDRLDRDGKASLRYAVEGARRMARLIDSLLKYSRAGTQELALESVDCKVLVQEVLEGLKPCIQEAKGSVEVGELPTIWGDRSQLGQLMQNLISNAIKYRGAQPPLIEISAYQCAKEWIFRVRDNGIGIAEKDQKKIFAVFQRLHSQTEYPGEGIGLAVAKQIVERHGGRIWIVSNVGGGSAFYFAIPKSTFRKPPSVTLPQNQLPPEGEPLAPPLGRTGSRG